jgi:Fic family protein
MYIHQLPDWTNFSWDQHRLSTLLADIRNRQGRLLGRMESLGFVLQNEAALETLTLEVVKTSEIEGEILDLEMVRSSIARHMGIEVAGIEKTDRNVEGIVEMMLDATRNFQLPLTTERLFGWHAALFPTGRSGMKKITVGNWRTGINGPMQVVSGPIGREKVHFEAPKAELVTDEMKSFLEWFNQADEGDPVLKAGIAHFWFVTIHPFEDGNGRIARAIAEMQLAKADQMAHRFYSMSSQIQQKKKTYYNTLEKTQKGTPDITNWVEWFLLCLGRSLSAAETTVGKAVEKSRIWEHLRTRKINDRQHLMINKLLDGFEGKLNTSKWARITKCSPDTALRDIQNLIDQDILEKEPAGGRSTGYILKRLHHLPLSSSMR